MSGLSEELGRKISGADDIAVVVRSMKALAASSITQYEQAAASLDAYTLNVRRALSVCLRALPADSRAAAHSKALPVGLIVFGSDQGLVGRFNEILWEFVEAHVASRRSRPQHVWAIGDRMNELVRPGYPTQSTVFDVPGSVAGITGLVDGLLIDLQKSIAAGVVSEILVFHHRHDALEASAPTLQRLLPFDQDWRQELQTLPWPSSRLPQVIGQPVDALPRFVEEYLFVLLFRASAQSLLSENASRLAAMQRAERNIDELRSDLKLRFQRVRQESIDEELFDLIAGYESIKIEERNRSFRFGNQPTASGTFARPPYRGGYRRLPRA